MGWSDPIWIAGTSKSRYDALGTMGDQLGAAFGRLGFDARPATMNLGPEGLVISFNSFAGFDAIPPAMTDPNGRVTSIQIMVDHPLMLHPPPIDAWDAASGLARTWTLLTSVDDAHLLRLRFPRMRHGYLLHGVDPSALIPDAGLEPATWRARPFDVLITGSITGEEEVNGKLATLPGRFRGAAERIARRLIHEPTCGYVRAADLELSAMTIPSGQWDVLAGLFPPVMAAVNRARRLTAVESLRGLRVGLVGGEAWREAEGDGIEYLGPRRYDEIPAAFAEALIGVGWGPVQFVDSISERPLLAMAAGCGVVCDDRPLARPIADGGRHAALYDPRDPAALRRAVDRLLASPDRTLAMARRGVEAVRSGHLWDHRAAKLLEIASYLRRDAAPGPTVPRGARVPA